MSEQDRTNDPRRAGVVDGILYSILAFILLIGLFAIAYSGVHEYKRHQANEVLQDKNIQYLMDKEDLDGS